MEETRESQAMSESGLSERPRFLQWNEQVEFLKGVTLILIHMIGERLEDIRYASASRGAGILPALANEVGKSGTLAAILSRPIGWRERCPPP